MVIYQKLLSMLIQRRGNSTTLKVRAKITSQNWRSDLVQVWLIRESKTAGIASYFKDFVNEASAKDGLKLRCKNVKLFLREPLVPRFSNPNIFAQNFGSGFVGLGNVILLALICFCRSHGIMEYWTKNKQRKDACFEERNEYKGKNPIPRS